MKNFIFFRNDRLGDFIILTNLIKTVKHKYKNSHVTVLCSPMNYQFIKNFRIIDSVYVYSKKLSFIKKVNLLFKIIKKNYYASFAVDGKSFSNICNFFINSKYKLGLVYKYKFLNFWFSKPNFLYNFFVFNKFETFTSKKDLKQIEHLPKKINNLGNFFNLKLNTNDQYYFQVDKKIHQKFLKYKKKYLNNKYILFHFDEKWKDIKFVDQRLLINLVNLQKKIKKKIVITSFKNNFDYYRALKKKLISKNIHLIENCDLYFFERLIKYSSYSISCHSGFMVQIAGANLSNLIDIINKEDYLWYSCWKPLNTQHKFIYKSNKFKRSIDDLFNDININVKFSSQ